MKLTVDLPENTRAVSITYIFDDEKQENILIGNSVLTGEDLNGKYVVKNIKEFEENA